MRKVLLLIASLFLVTASALALHNDFYNQVLSHQTVQCLAEKNSIGQPPVMLAGNNMITDGQQPGLDLFGERAAASSRSDFYRAVLAERVEDYKAENESNWAGPTLLAGNNMIGGWPSSGREGQDFYNGVLSAKNGEFKAENNAIGTGPVLLANMITDERVFVPEAAPEDFYNRTLSAKVAEYGIDNNAIAPSATEFAETPSLTVLPGSMAANVGRGESDWYGRTVAIQAEMNRRIKKSQSGF
jgi:hypothetical protein